MLFTPRLLLLNEGQTTTLKKSTLLGQAIYVVPRGDCSFRRMRMAGKSRDAKAAAQLKARNEALPNENGCRVVIDSSPASENSAGAPLASIWSFPTPPNRPGRYLPETLAQVPLHEGARLVEGLSGFEGQIWKNNDLAASRWWSRAPTETHWDSFIRSAQESLGPLDMPRPAAARVEWRQDLAIFDIDRDRLSQIFSPFNVGAIIASLLACGALFICGQYLRESLALSAVETQIADIRSDTEQIQSERRRALTNMSFVRKYRNLGDNGRLLSGLGAVANVLGHTDLGIEHMGLRGDSLELRLKGEDEISVPEIVNLLEAQAVLSDVSISLETAGAISVKARISEPKGASKTPAETDTPTDDNAGGTP